MIIFSKRHMWKSASHGFTPSSLHKNLFPTVIQFFKDPSSNNLVPKGSVNAVSMEHAGFILNIEGSDYIAYSLATSHSSSLIGKVEINNIKGHAPIIYMNSLIFVKRGVFRTYFGYSINKVKIYDRFSPAWEVKAENIYYSLLKSFVDLHNSNSFYIVGSTPAFFKIYKNYLTVKPENIGYYAGARDSNTIYLPIQSCAIKLDDAGHTFTQDSNLALTNSLAQISIDVNWTNGTGFNNYAEVIYHEHVKGLSGSKGDVPFTI